MTEAMIDTAATANPDAITEQVSAPKPVETPVIDKSLDETLRDEVAKAVKPKAEPVKDDALDAKAKPEVKPGPVAKPDAVKPVAKEPAPDGETAPLEAPKPAPRPTAYREPPSGFDDAAKGEWESVPESVRGAVHRRAQEMEQGIQKYRADAQSFEPLRKYDEMAKQSGTTVDKALGRYIGMEQKLRSDPMGGLEEIVANLGLRKADGNPVTLRDVAASIMGQTPDQNASRQDATIQRLTQQLQQVTQQLGGISQHVEGQHRQAQVSAAQSEWDKFAQTKPPVSDALYNSIADNLRLQNPEKFDNMAHRLRNAYAVAISENPSVAHTDPTPLAQTQLEAKPAPNPAGQKSISGIGGGTQSARITSSDEALKWAISGLKLS